MFDRFPTWSGTCDTNPPFALRLRSSKAFIYWAICIAIFTDVFLYSVIVPVIPVALHTRAGIPESDTQRCISLLLAAYGGALLVGSVLFGWIADRTSRIGPLLWGLLLLTSSTLLLCLARRFWVFIIARVFQGLSASIVWSVGLALLVDTAGKDEIGQAMGYISIPMTLGMFSGPLLGGIVFERAGYLAVMGMALGLLLLDIILRVLMIERKATQKWLEQGQGQELQPDTVITKESAQLELSLPSASRPESQPPPLFTLVKSGRMLAALGGVMVQSLLGTSFDSSLPLFVESVFGWNSMAAGLVFLPLIIPSLLGPVVGWATDKYGPRWLATAGFALAVPMLVGLRLISHDSITQNVLLCFFLFGVGIAIALPDAPLMAEIMHVVDAKEIEKPGIFGRRGAYAQAYGLFNVAFASGTMIGPIWAGFVKDRAGWGSMTMSLAILSGLTCIPIALCIGGLFWKANLGRKY